MSDRFKSDIDSIHKKIEELESQSGGLFYKPKQGKNNIRVLPADHEKGLNVFYYEYYQHFNLGKRGFVCNRTFHKKCLICRKVEQWAASDDTKKQKIADKIYASERYALTIIDLDASNKKPQIFNAPKSVLTQLLSLYSDPDYQDFTHPIRGYDLVLKKEGEKLNTKYFVTPRRTESRLAKKSWLKNRPDYDKIYKPYQKSQVIEALKMKLRGKEETRKEEDDD